MLRKQNFYKIVKLQKPSHVISQKKFFCHFKPFQKRHSAMRHPVNLLKVIYLAFVGCFLNPYQKFQPFLRKVFFLKMCQYTDRIFASEICLHTSAILHILPVRWHLNCPNRPILTMLNLRSTCARFCEKGFSIPKSSFYCTYLSSPIVITCLRLKASSKSLKWIIPTIASLMNESSGAFIEILTMVIPWQLSRPSWCL